MFARDHVNCLSLTARAIIRGSLLTTCNNLEDLLTSIVDLTTAAVVGTIIGSLSNHDEGGAKNVTKLQISQWKPVVLHALQVQFSFLYNVKWPVLQLWGRREHMMTNFRCFLVISKTYSLWITEKLLQKREDIPYSRCLRRRTCLSSAIFQTGLLNLCTRFVSLPLGAIWFFMMFVRL